MIVDQLKTSAATCRSIRTITIAGISSMIRDLRILTSEPERLERAIVTNALDLAGHLDEEITIVSDGSLFATVGDIIAFRLLNNGAYPDMETLWGGRVALIPNQMYVGVICERSSTKLMTASFEAPLRYEDLTLQLIAQAGGVGPCTGFSPLLRDQNGSGRASNVEVLGVLFNSKLNRRLNIVEESQLEDIPSRIVATIPPTIMVLGTATDVGKTTLIQRLIKIFSVHYSCAAIKASGTGWWEDSILHLEGGAAFAINYTFGGLPTTYYVNAALYRKCLYRLYSYIASPHLLPQALLPPATRNMTLKTPDILFVEHGGDMIWANIPTFLADVVLMRTVKIIVICVESALSLIGAISELKTLGIHNTGIKIFASMPLMNPEAYYLRIKPLIDSGQINGVIDISKPVGLPRNRWASEYSYHYDEIMVPEDMIRQFSPFEPNLTPDF